MIEKFQESIEWNVFEYNTSVDKINNHLYKEYCNNPYENKTMILFVQQSDELEWIVSCVIDRNTKQPRLYWCDVLLGIDDDPFINSTIRAYAFVDSFPKWRFPK